MLRGDQAFFGVPGGLLHGGGGGADEGRHWDSVEWCVEAARRPGVAPPTNDTGDHGTHDKKHAARMRPRRHRASIAHPWEAGCEQGVPTSRRENGTPAS